MLPALIRKIHEARPRDEASVTVWGTGTPRREFLYVDDLADARACISDRRTTANRRQHRHRRGRDDPRTGRARDVGGRLQGPLVFDTTKPDGTPRKLLDVSR